MSTPQDKSYETEVGMDGFSFLSARKMEKIGRMPFLRLLFAFTNEEIPSLSEGTDGEIETYGVSLVPLPLHSIDSHLFPPSTGI